MSLSLGTACVSVEAPPETSRGPGGCLQQRYAVALGHGALFPFHKMPPNQKGNAVQVKQMSGNCPTLIREAPGSSSCWDPATRAEPTFLRLGMPRSSSAPACNQGPPRARRGMGEQRNPTSLSSFCETAERTLHVRECILKPAPGRCSNHDSLCMMCPARRPLGRRGSAPTPTASPLAVQQFTLE